MATKAATQASKVTAKKAAPPTAKKAAPAAVKKPAPAAAKSKSRAAASKPNKGDGYQCEICGLEVVVDECGDVLETTALYCCEKAMKKTATAKAAKK
jgi:hypothetical protein